MCGSKFNKPFMVHVYHPCFRPLQLGDALCCLSIGLAAPTCVNVKNTSLLQKGGSRYCKQVANSNLSNCLQFLIAYKDRHLAKDKETKP